MVKSHPRINCPSCSGTGLYQGFAEGPGDAVVCCYCLGTGFSTISEKDERYASYTPFTGIVPKEGVERVFKSRGPFIMTGIGPSGSPISYEAFSRGERP